MVSSGAQHGHRMQQLDASKAFPEQISAKVLELLGPFIGKVEAEEERLA